MKWLTKGMVESFHQESLVRFGGAQGFRDDGLLESALARPENIHVYQPEADIFTLAAAYCTGTVKNHPFVDGNKRTALLSAIVFLQVNGVTLEFSEASIVTMVIGLAEGEIGKEEFSEWLRRAAR